MNSSLQKALVASMLAVGGAVSALGQSSGYDWDAHCIDPNNTAPYSVDFISYYMETPLWSAGLGIQGTVAYKNCVPFGPGGSVAVRGRFAMGPGPVGSIQDDLRLAAQKYDVSPDNFQDMQYGVNHSRDPYDAVPKGYSPNGAQSGFGWSFARIYRQTGTNVQSDLFGKNGMSIAFVGASNRYMFAETSASNIDARLVMDVLGETARFSWRLTNNTTASVGLGLWLGQWMYPMGGYGSYNATYTPVDNYGQYLGYVSPTGALQPYVTVPGRKPLEVDTRFIRSNDPSNFPAYIDFTGGEFDPFTDQQKISPQLGGGLQVVLSPYQNVSDELGQSDQTPVDEAIVGDIAFAMGGAGAVTDPAFNDVTFADANFSTGCCFVEKWQPTVNVPVGGFRDIVSYYRSVWGDSNYANGYTAVVDTPKVLSASKGDPTQFDPNPFTIQVSVDNTGGFGQVYKSVPMNNVAVTLKLPQGMHAIGNPAQTTITQYIPVVAERSISSIQFQVQAETTVFGALPYSVVVQPSPGATKTINGTINVAATPNLQLIQGANLVTSPWSYSDSTWETVLSPLVPVQDYQAYTWDPAQQAYIVQTGPQRGIGTWLVLNNTQGFVTLKGNPKQPTDELPPSSGAPNIQLQAGWNLIGNPYNYTFPLGQLVGVPSGTSTALTFSELVSQNIFDGSFAYYDPQLQSYNFLQNPTDELLPNYGYWVYATTPLTLNFPPIFDLFVRAPKPKPNHLQLFNHWKLQLAATGSYFKDLNNFVGLDTNVPAAAAANSRKEPISPAKNAIRAYVTSQYAVATGGQGLNSRVSGNSEYAQMIHSSFGKQVFNYNVYSAGDGPVTVSWPNLSSLPKNLAVTIRDLSNNTTVNARSAPGYSYYGSAHTLKSMQVTVTPQGTVRQTVGQVSTQVRNTGSTKQMTIGFNCSTSGAATLSVYQNGQKVATIVQNMAISAGANSVVWPMTLTNGQVIAPGNYVLQISALGEGGDVANKLVNLSL